MNLKPFFLFLGISLPCFLNAQQNGDFPFRPISLENLDQFQSKGSNWQIVGGVEASFEKKQQVKTSAGSGILVNLPDKENQSQLFTTFEHGDLDLELEFMMPAGSNSGIYLQGRYEIQLLDSWGKKRPAFGDVGGIYQRWDDTQPEGSKGFEGTAPTINVAKAPGLWQTMRISFQAPRFNSAGDKTQNARIIFVELNGVVIHRNVELTGPTRGPYVEGEGSTGPIVIQGDHGPVAFRNFAYRSFSGKPVTIKDLQYQVVRQPRSEFKDWESVAIDSKGKEDLLTWEVVKSENNFALLYTGKIEVPSTGKYVFRFTSGGQAKLTLNSDLVFPYGQSTRTKTLTLDAGEHPFELEYTKTEPWIQGRLGLEVAGEDFRPVTLNGKSSNVISSPVDPIFVRTGSEAKHLRSFVDFKMPPMEETKRITNAINIGDPNQLHYTYDLNQGSLVQIWRGRFLNATPMWNNRGNGVSVPRGAVLPLTANPQLLQQQSDGNLSAKFSDNVYRYKSYRVDSDNRPTFHYVAYGLKVSDQITPQNDRKGMRRKLTFSGQPKNQLVYCLAAAEKVERIEKGLYIIGDAQYYIQSDHALNIKAMADNQQALVFPVSGTSDLQYQIIW